MRKGGKKMKNPETVIKRMFASRVVAAFGAVAMATVTIAADLRTCDYIPQHGVAVGGFWREQYRQLTLEWLPHCIEQMEKGGRGEELMNIVGAAEVVAGRKTHAKYKGRPWSDAYPYNVAESICLALEIDPGKDAEWRKGQQFLRDKLEEWIGYFLAAQEASGYVHSYHILNRREHFRGEGDHEFYAMGYFIELGVAHMRMTRGADRRLFEAAIRCADHLDGIFGPAPKRTWVNGHAGIEYAFLRLADACERWNGRGSGEKYARLAQFFVRNQHVIRARENRGKVYDQTEQPAEEMTEARGHAVRACYFYTAMAGIGSRLNDARLAAASDRIFANAIDRKEYITGGVGASENGEAFGKDYDLLLSGYCEACAACGMDFWCTELHMAGRGEKPEDVRERLLYNAVLGALGKDRRTFLYCNPPNGSELFYPWNGCPCCVGNIPRTLLALKDTLYTFARDGRTLWVDQFMASESDVSLGGRRFHAVMKTAYPDSGTVTLTLSPKPDFEVVVRFPDRTESPLYTAVPAVEHGYRTMKPVSVTEGSATYSWTLPMPYQEVTADERVEACRGRKAYQRGPTVYSWEGPFGDICVPNRSRLRDGGFSAVWKLTAPPQPIGGCALHTWNTAAEYRNLSIVDRDGKVLWQGLPDPAKCKRGKGGKWQLDGDVLRQSNPRGSNTELRFGDPAWRDYTVRFQARRIGGAEGFIFHVRDESSARAVWINLGASGNTRHTIEAHGYVGYDKDTVAVPGKLENERWYDVEIRCRGNAITVLLDGATVFDAVEIIPGEYHP